VATFLLIHGGYHGGWCWDLVAQALKAEGHAVVAPDMPIDDPATSFDDYATAVVQALDDTSAGRPLARPIITVGHSLGGHIAPLVAQQRPCDHLVYLCCVPSGLGQPIGLNSLAIVTEELRSVTYFTNPQGLSVQTPESFARLFYADVKPELALDALRRLRPEGPRLKTDAWPLQQWPDVPRTVILARDDRVVAFEAARAAAVEFTGSQPLVAPGGHSVMLAHPEWLVRTLTRLATAAG
jgi:pimeloyl-ACP methyl ester carboxylesterase